MAEVINWIHLTDLHLGLDAQSWLWPKVKHDLFGDIEKLRGEAGVWDLVFFTGDLTQRGERAEFDRLSKELGELWEALARGGSRPLLCVVPGNHDLVRPQPDSLILKALSQLWWSDKDLRLQFWRDANCEYRRAVAGFFENYVAWTARAPVPMVQMSEGVLPGDFSATFEKGQIKLGLVGLNSSFLQLTDDDFKGRLDLHTSQVNAVCDGDPVRWCRGRTASVLLTHHPPSWLAPEALDHFRQEIYPPGRFLAQLCGHQHVPEASDLSEGGAAPRRLRQAPSLFGLEHWGCVEPQKRLHGYTAGQFEFKEKESGGYEKLWPRHSVKARDGGLNICPDHTYRLRDDCTVTSFELDADDGCSSLAHGTEAALDSVAASEFQAASATLPLHLLDGMPDEQSARAKLGPCPRLDLSFGPQHGHIREDERSGFEHELRESRWAWLIADWGTAAREFLASSIERFCTPRSSVEVFHLRCDDAFDVDSLEALFPQQFGMPLQDFCAFVAPLKGTFLVLDEIQPPLHGAQSLKRLREIASAVRDYCPELRLIFVSRLRPEGDPFPVIELRPLDIPDVRTYLTHHPEAAAELREPDVVERLYERSDGLPMHLDRILRSLKVSSLASALADIEEPSAGDGTPDSTPKSLVYAVSTLAKSRDKRSGRSFRLLKVLCVLPYGETLEALHHYLPAEPFFYENALQLMELALLDAVPLQHTGPRMQIGHPPSDEQSGPKILKVPRQVRDYAHTLLSEREREEIVLAGAEHFFGRRWRDGKLKLRSLPLEYEGYVGRGKGNEFAVIQHLIAHARNCCDEALLRRSFSLGIQYAAHLKSRDRYRDLAMVAGDLIQSVDREQYPDEWRELAALYGEGLRMTDKDQEAVRYFREALALGESHFSHDERASLWESISFGEESLGNPEAAVAAAQEVQRCSKPGSGWYLQAEATITSVKLEGSDRTTRLAEIERQARDSGYTIVADNIALMLVDHTESVPAKIRQYDKVLAAKERGWNQVRAVVAKAGVVQRSGGRLSTQEVAALASAYSYLHSQRSRGLLDRCHQRLWRVFEAEGDNVQMLRLFRNTSFLWRIRGDEAKEAAYVKRLSKRDVREDDAAVKGVLIEVRYFMRRFSVMLSLAAGGGAGA